MNKIAVVLGVAAVVTFAGCKDPNYVPKYKTSNQDEVKVVPTEAEKAPAATDKTPAPAEKKCTCAPGTKHAAPCACGAADCKCVVEAPAPAPTPAVATKPAEPEYTIYIVQNGDFLSKISQRYNITVSSIKRLNNLKGDSIRVGQKLKLPGKVDVGVQTAPSKTVKAPAKTTYSGETKEYVVKSGDTLGSIAYGNGINIRQLKALNGLQKDTLQVGQKLKIPANGKAAAATKKADKKTAKPAAKPATETAPAAAPAAEAAPAAPAAETAPTAEAAPAAAPAAEAAAEAAPAAQPAVKTQEYVVQQDDDITSVSIDFGVSAAVIRELNGLKDTDTLAVGQKIKVPVAAQ